MNKIRLFILAVFAIIAGSPAYAVCTKAGITAAITAAYPTQLVGVVTPTILRNNMIANFNCVATLDDSQTFSQPQTFTSATTFSAPPIFTGKTGYLYANGSNPATFIATPPPTTPVVFNVAALGADKTCATDATTSINTTIIAAIAAGGGILSFDPGCYLVGAGSVSLLVDLSAVGSPTKRLIFQGSGIGATEIRSTVAGSAAAFVYTGNTGGGEISYLTIRDLKFTGGGSGLATTGIRIQNAAYFNLESVDVETFGTAVLGIDVEQSLIKSSNFRFNANGIVFTAAICCTGPNSLTFLNSAVNNNTTTGFTITGGLNLNFYGGSVQYNGIVGGGGAQHGAALVDMVFGGAVFSGVDFEGNGGAGDLLLVNNAASSSVTVALVGNSFVRTTAFGPTVGYGTNNISMAAASTTKQVLTMTGNFFGSGAGYTPSGARPNIAISGAGTMQIRDDASNIFQNSAEAPTYVAANMVPVWGSQLVGGAAQGILANFTTNPLIAHNATNQNFAVAAPFNGTGLSVGSYNDAGNTLLPLELRSSATYVSNLSTAGYVCAAATSGLLSTGATCTVSDARLKNWEGSLTGSLASLLKLRGGRFTYTAEGEKVSGGGAGQQIGVLAQDVEKVFPELVETGSDGWKRVDYQKLVAPIIEALRELKADNDDLRARMNRRRR